MWTPSRGLSLVLSALLLFSFSAYSEAPPKAYIITAEEMEQLETIFWMLRAENEKQKTELSALRKDLTAVGTSLKGAEESLKEYAREMNRALLTARTKTVLYAILGVAAGGLAGYIYRDLR